MSSLRILHHGLRDHVFPEVPAEIVRRAHVDTPAAHHRGELTFHRRQTQQSGYVAGFELNQHVDIACRAEVVPHHRPEQGETANAVLLAERA